jgi:hypothetical protein
MKINLNDCFGGVVTAADAYSELDFCGEYGRFADGIDYIEINWRDADGRCFLATIMPPDAELVGDKSSIFELDADQYEPDARRHYVIKLTAADMAEIMDLVEFTGNMDSYTVNFTAASKFCEEEYGIDVEWHAGSKPELSDKF